MIIDVDVAGEENEVSVVRYVVASVSVVIAVEAILTVLVEAVCCFFCLVLFLAEVEVLNVKERETPTGN